MNTRLLAATALLLGCDSTAAADPVKQPILTVHFSPKGGCADAVVDLIASAKVSIRLAGYSFTSVPIAVAMVTAQRNGVDVRLVLDKSDAGPKAVRGSKALVVAGSGAHVWIDRKHAIFHDKYLVVDDRIVETGSFNYTQAAEGSNAENCLFIRDVAIARQYSDNWVEHQKHATEL